MTTLMILCTAPDERLEMAFEEAKRLGYRTVFCSEQDHAPSREAADAFHLVHWEDTAELVRIAREEKIDGVAGLCDAAMIPAAEISKALGLPGNSRESMQRLLYKKDFRSLQEEAGVYCPASMICEGQESAAEAGASLRFPLIVKPMLCSSSHGMTVVQSAEELPQAFDIASGWSRNGTVCVEEFVHNDSMRIIEADVFVMEDEILWDGVRYCYRLPSAPLRPVYDVYPVHMTQAEQEELRNTVRAVLMQAGVRLGEYNVEGFFTPEGRFFILEINPRQAGHYNPQDIQQYCGVNLTKLVITTAVGDTQYYDSLKSFSRTRNNILSYSVFSERDGIFDHIYVEPQLKEKIVAVRFLHGQKEGDFVREIHEAIRPIAKVVFRFETEEALEEARSQITKLVYPVLRESSGDIG